MRVIFKSLTIAAIILYSIAAKAQKGDEVCYNPNMIKDTTRKSIKSMALAIVAGDSVKISYHSPGVRKRIIWGGLVPYDEVWVTGAHDATTIEIARPFTIDGKVIAAGRYAFFTIPGRKEWIIILNRKWQQHLASEYDEKDDIIRLKVKPKKITHTERLQYFIEPVKDNKILVAVAWEKIKIEFPIVIDN